MAISFLFGILLGLVFFGGLWLSVERLAKSRRPAILMTFSMLLRMAVLLGGFYLILQSGRIENALSAMAGIFVARTLVVQAVKKRKQGE